MKPTARRILFLFLVIFVLSSSGQAASVYLMPTGNSPADGAALRALEAGGHRVFFGVQAQTWTGTQADLNDYDAVVILNSFNAAGSMPRGGTSALVNYVFNGGGVVTGELFNYNIDQINRHAGAEALMPVRVPQRNSVASTTYVQVTPDPIINDGLPETFTFSLRNFAGTESSFTTRGEATIVFYSSTNGGGRPNSPGVVGWNILNGKVLSFSTNITDTELASEDYQRLLSNSVNWVTRQADIAVTKVASAGTVPRGSNIVYTITFSNNGPSPALPVTLTDDVPAQTTFQSLEVPAGWSCDTPNIGGTGTIACTISTWNIYSTSIFKLVVRVDGKTPEGTVINNTANVSWPGIDPNPDNNSATAAVTVTAPAP